MSDSHLLLIAGIVLVVTAIVGGAITYRDLAIPKISSLTRQLLLGAFGMLLIVAAYGYLNLHIVFFLGWISLVLSGLVRSAESNAKYNRILIAQRNNPKELLGNAEAAFWKRDYKWAARFVTQAKAAVTDDAWESGYAFLFGAQLALSQKDAARASRMDLVNSLRRAAHEKTGYFSSAESVRHLSTNLVAMRSQIAPERGMTERYVGPIRAEIDLVLQAIDDVLHPEEMKTETRRRFPAG